MKGIFFLLLSTVLLASCNTYDIQRQNTNVGGIPFYSQKHVVKQTTTYHRTWLEVAIDYHDLKNDKKKIEGSDRKAILHINPTTFDETVFRFDFEEIQSGLEQSGNIAFDEFVKNFLIRINKRCDEFGVNCAIPVSVLQAEARVNTRQPLENLLQTEEGNTTTLEMQIDYSKPSKTS